MPEIKKAGAILSLRIWGLPINVDVEDLTKKAGSVAQSLEALGCYNQREFTPAHLFHLKKAEV